MSWTPGPWIATHVDSEGYSDVRDKGGVLICRCYWPDEARNANTIASLPDLLAALEEIQQRLLGKVVVNHNDIGAVCTIACQALEKVQDGKI